MIEKICEYSNMWSLPEKLKHKEFSHINVLIEIGFIL